jgi:hypothetical protein
MIPLIPYHRVTIQSPLTPAVIADRIMAETAQPLWFRRPNAERMFAGSVKSDAFVLWRNILGRNTYLPRLVGRFRAVDGGTELVVTMAIQPIVAIVVVLLFLIFPEYLLAVTKEGSVSVIWLALMLVFHVVMWIIGFRPEAMWAEQQLRELAAEQPREANAGSPRVPDLHGMT